MELQAFLTQLNNEPEKVEFDDTMAVIETNYAFTPTAFRNGECQNAAGQNNGSCKILAFGMVNQLSPEQTLACFGRFYRDDVLGNPNGDDHQNIRNFINSGWGGVKFESPALSLK
ncbi:HopJ type III effector protein [Methylophaga sp. OBS4]|uniref:HopJ type III effector protein n=1 Tax=Methylophaga sp. OBS4 TaxID=2991935 RepID=UPI002252AC58|nr:HopJ type III effector protein [Methylophaga sp. OBS4]MCX4188349.1 HopJ type III effector protein [Methylophaga sp. OBS4]